MTSSRRFGLFPAQLRWLLRLIWLPFLVGAALLGSPDPARAVDADRELGELSVESWRAREGLPGAWVRGIAQTPDGYLWVGTQAGLVRHGGGPLLPFSPTGQFEHGADVMGLLGARDGTVWVTPARGHPVCVRGQSFGACFSDAAGMPAGTRIVDITEDPGGVIWIAAGEGIYRLNGARLQLVKPAAAWGSLPVTAVQHDQRGRLWVGTAGGLFVGPGAGPASQPLSLHLGPQGPVTAAVTGMFRSPAGKLWVAADRTLISIAGDQTVQLGPRDGLPEGRLTRLLEDRDGNLWVGSREGLIRYRAGTGFTSFNLGDGLPDDDVSALFEDREGSLWVGTRAAGLAQFTDRTLDRRSGPPSLREQWISTVAEDAQGALWTASGRGLTRWQDGRERTFAAADGLPGEQALSLQPDGQGQIWVGTERGLGRLRGQRIEAIAGVEGPVSALYLESDGTLWVGAARGLDRLAPGATAPTHFPLAAEDQEGEIRAIARDDQGVLWLSANGKLRRLALDGNAGDQVLRRDHNPQGAAIMKVRAMHRDRSGTLWLGTADGLFRRRQGRWRRFAGAEGLARDDLFQVVTDDMGYLWAGAPHGVLRLSLAALEEVDQGRRPSLDPVAFEIADQRREVRITRTRQPGSWLGAQGRLRFATSRGVVTVDPRRLPVNDLPPPVFIEKALVDGRPAQAGAGNQFPPGSGALEFHFAAITLIEPRKAQHRYMLEGFDRQWVDAGTRRAAYYTNIGPGHYRFRVQGSNADGVWNQTGATLALTLTPHFYQTGWFYGLAGLLALSLVLTIHRLRVARLHGRHAATITERARMARELHDSLLQGMSAALLHLRGLRKRFAPEAAPAPAATIAAEIKTIEELMASNIEETRAAVWDLRERPASHGNGSGATLASDLGELLRRVVPAGEGRPQGRLVVEGRPLPVPGHARRELLRIAHEALTNTLKHARANHLELGLRYDESALHLRVSDDGVGFDPQGAAGVGSGHFGLTGMRERAALLGRFALESQPQNGTKVEVTVNLKDLRDV